MNPQHSIISEIFTNLIFTEKEKNTIEKSFQKVEVKKGAIILNAGEIVNHQYYVYNGCLRTFYIDGSGKEHTLQFAVKDWWLSDFTAFFNTSKAIMHIECIQDATLYKISRTEIDSLYKNIPVLETFFRKKLEKAFSGFQKRILNDLALPAKDRYLSFINQYPNIEQNVKNYHIASYLGITTESLSRIRKDLNNK